MAFLTPGCLTRLCSQPSPTGPAAQSDVDSAGVSLLEPSMWFQTGFQKSEVGSSLSALPALLPQDTPPETCGTLSWGSQHKAAFSSASCLGLSIPSLIKVQLFDIVRWSRVQAQK